MHKYHDVRRHYFLLFIVALLSKIKMSSSSNYFYIVIRSHFEIWHLTLTPQSQCFYHIEIGQLIPIAEQFTGFYQYVKRVRIRSFYGPFFPAFGLNTERYVVSLRIQSECGKI